MPSEVPSGWREIAVSEILRLEYGRAMPADVRTGTGFPVYGSAGVVGAHESASVAGPGIVVGRKGTAGAVHWVDSDFVPIDTTYFVRKRNDADWKWLYFALCEWDLPALAESTGVPGLNRDRVAQLKVHIPPLPEQKKIAAILSSVDEAIRATQAVIDQTRRVKEGLLQELLTRGIGPDGKPHTRFKQTEIGAVPEGWEVHALGVIAEVSNGSTPSRVRADYWEHGTVPWVASGKVNDFIVSAASEYITEKALAECPLRLLPAGTVIVGMIGQGRTRGMSARLAIDAAINQNVAGVLPGERLTSDFLHAVLTRDYEVLRASGRGSNQDALNCGILKSYKIPVPPRHEQVRINSVVAAVDRKLVCSEDSVCRLSTLKSSLLTALLTGQVRVNP